MAIPERIQRSDVKGYVFCPNIPPLPYRNKSEKEDLIALAEIFLPALEKGDIKLEGYGTKLTVKQQGEWRKQEKAALDLISHGNENGPLYTDKELAKFSAWAQTQKKIKDLTKEEFDKIIS